MLDTWKIHAWNWDTIMLDTCLTCLTFSALCQALSSIEIRAYHHPECFYLADMDTKARFHAVCSPPRLILVVYYPRNHAWQDSPKIGIMSSIVKHFQGKNYWANSGTLKLLVWTWRMDFGNKIYRFRDQIFCYSSWNSSREILSSIDVKHLSSMGGVVGVVGGRNRHEK